MDPYRRPGPPAPFGSGEFQEIGSVAYRAGGEGRKIADRAGIGVVSDQGRSGRSCNLFRVSGLWERATWAVLRFSGLCGLRAPRAQVVPVPEKSAASMLPCEAATVDVDSPSCSKSHVRSEAP